MKTRNIVCCIVSLLLQTLQVAAQSSHWGEVNPHDYQYDMTIYATLSIDDEHVTAPSLIDVAAFVEGELRGVGRVETKDDRQWIYLRVYSNVSDGETVTFRNFDGQTEQYVKTTFPFAASSTEGLPTSAAVVAAYNPYTLTVKVDGVVVKTETLHKGDEINPGTYAKTGYTFAWTTQPPTVMSASDLTIEGTFTINQYTVTFMADGVVVKQGRQDYASAIIPPADPEKDGYTFTGWSPQPLQTVPDGDVTYVAQFEPILVSEISFDDATPEVGEDGTVQLRVSVTPADALDPTLSFTSSDTDIATVSPTGLVTFHTYGTVTITVQTTDGSHIARTITLTRPEPFEPQDVNHDGIVDTQDALAVYEFMQQYDGTMPLGVYDVNHDGQVDTQDVLAIYEYMQNN